MKDPTDVPPAVRADASEHLIAVAVPLRFASHCYIRERIIAHDKKIYIYYIHIQMSNITDLRFCIDLWHIVYGSSFLRLSCSAKRVPGLE